MMDEIVYDFSMALEHGLRGVEGNVPLVAYIRPLDIHNHRDDIVFAIETFL